MEGRLNSDSEQDGNVPCNRSGINQEYGNGNQAISSFKAWETSQKESRVQSRIIDDRHCADKGSSIFNGS